MDRTTFNYATQSAINDGQFEKIKQAQKYAASFLNGNSQFSPIDLEKLGTVGLAQFLETVGSTGVRFNNPSRSDSAPEQQQSQPSDAISPGWRNQRRSEPSLLLHALAWGITTGLLPIFVGLIHFTILKP